MAKVLKGDFNRKTSNNTEKKKSDKPIPGYQLKMAVAFSDPLIYRTVRVPGDMTLAELHVIIQICMGWGDIDTHQFLVGKIFYQSGFGIADMKMKPEYDENNFELHQLEEGMQFIFTYLYDGGEGWELEINLEEVIPQGHQYKHPVLVAGERGCPPEEIGDIHQYQGLLAALESAGDKALLTLAIPGFSEFDPVECDMEAINKRLVDIYRY